MTDTLEQHQIERDADLPLAFTGEVIAEAHSYETGKLRWTELTLYRTSSGKYVLHEEGITEVDDEDDRSSAYVSEDAGELIASLYKVNARGKRYLTKLAQELVARAAVADPGIRAHYVVEV